MQAVEAARNRITVNSRQRSTWVAFGAKRTLTEPRREQPKIVNPRKQWQPLMNSAMLAARSDQGERR